MAKAIGVRFLTRLSVALLLAVTTHNGTASTAPAEGDFKNCPAAGDPVPHSDQILNALKNRSMQVNAPRLTSWAEIAHLPHPNHPVPRLRKDWAPTDLNTVEQFERTGVVIEGYLYAVKREGLEHCNCERQDLNDFHMWLAPTRTAPQSHTMVVELAPRWRDANQNWSKQILSRLASQHARIRITGWMMFDQEHPEQLHPAANRDATRATLWEVHPVTKIEAFSGNLWHEL